MSQQLCSALAIEVALPVLPLTKVELSCEHDGPCYSMYRCIFQYLVLITCRVTVYLVTITMHGEKSLAHYQAE